MPRGRKPARPQDAELVAYLDEQEIQTRSDFLGMSAESFDKLTHHSAITFALADALRQLRGKSSKAATIGSVGHDHRGPEPYPVNSHAPLKSVPHSQVKIIEQWTCLLNECIPVFFCFGLCFF